MRVKASPNKVLPRAQRQVEGLREHPELADGLPVPPAELAGALHGLHDLMARREAARQEVALLAGRVHEAAFNLRELVQRNVGAVQAKFGRYALELIAVGGKPLTGNRRVAKSAAASESVKTTVAA